MICNQCGYEAGDAKFCPRCGCNLMENRTSEQTQQAQSTQFAQSAQFGQFGQPTESTQFAQFGQPTEYAQYGQPTEQAQFGQPAQFAQFGQPGMKKKKKWPKVLGIIAALAVVLGVGIFFAYPYLSNIFSPKKQAVTALKNAGNDFEQAVAGAFDRASNTASLPNKQEWKGSVRLDHVMYDQENLMDMLNVDTLQYDCQFDVGENKLSGVLGLAAKEASPVLTIQFYMDDSALYFKVPELLEESFKVPLNTLDIGGLDAGSISDMMSGGSTQILSQYSEALEALVEDLMQGFDVLIEKCTYNKLSNKELQSGDKRINASAYRVMITRDAVAGGIGEAIDAVFSDSRLSLYVGMLSSAVNVSKETIKKDIEDSLKNMRDIPFMLYVKNSRIVGIEIEFSDIDPDMSGSLTAKFLGKTASEFVELEIYSDEMKAVFTYDATSGSQVFDVSLEPVGTGSSGQFIKMHSSMREEGSGIVIDEFSLTASVDDVYVDAGCSASASVSEFSTQSLAASDFKNAIDITRNMTQRQQQSLYLELADNISVLKKIFSDKLYSQLLEMM